MSEKMESEENKNLYINNITPKNKKYRFKEDSFNIEENFDSLNQEFSDYSFKTNSNNITKGDKTYNKQIISEKPTVFRKKIISSNKEQYRNINPSILINDDKEYIKRKRESDEHRERERKIFEWFYINGINISKRDLYEAFSTLIQSVFRGYLYRKNIENDFRLNILLGVIYKLYLNHYLRNIYDFIKYKSNKISHNTEDASIFIEIKELIKQNNELQKKLEKLLKENNELRREREKYEENEKQYLEVSKKIENLLTFTEENKKLKEEMNILNNKTPKNNEHCFSFNKLIIEQIAQFNIGLINNKGQLNENNIVLKSNNQKWNNFVIVKNNNIKIVSKKI
jgi:hypothetical protein